jgi:hypothetical protein
LKLVVASALYQGSDATLIGLTGGVPLLAGDCSAWFASCARPGIKLAPTTSTKQIPITTRFMVYYLTGSARLERIKTQNQRSGKVESQKLRGVATKV